MQDISMMAADAMTPGVFPEHAIAAGTRCVDGSPTGDRSFPPLTRVEFAAAVKEALRQYTRTDVLAASPLLQAHLLAQRTAGAATVKDLCDMLAETAGALFTNTRDEKLYRVVDLTYLNPVPKQEAAADRLGLSLSTYRRYLRTGVERVCDWLWRQEQEARQSRPPPSPTYSAPPDAAGPNFPGTSRRLSIVVLPFLNLSPEPGLDYLVDGIVDSLMTDLSRALPGSFVISRSTAFTYRGRQIPIRQIGKELNVRYALEGSVVADSMRVRVNVQLIDAQTEEHLWAERFDKERRDVLEVQEEIVARLSRSVGIEMVRREASYHRPAACKVVDAADLAMRGKALAEEIRDREKAARALLLFREALVLDPDNVEVLVGIASTLVYQVLNLYRTDERDALLDEAEGLIDHAVALAPDHIGACRAGAALLRARGRFMAAVAATRIVIERNPGDPTAYRELGLNKLYLGATREAAEWFRRADRIAPNDPTRWSWLQGLGRALIQLGDYAEAADALRLAIQSNAGFKRGKAYLAAAEALAGELELAKRHMAEFALIDPGLTVRDFALRRSSVPVEAVSPIYIRENDRILDGLRLAGMPST
jgi:TolB-like protein